MKILKLFFLVFLSVAIVIWLLSYFLNVNLFSILKIQSPNIEISEPSYKLTSNPLPDPVFLLYDTDCNSYGPYNLRETVLEIQKGLSTTCDDEISDENYEPIIKRSKYMIRNYIYKLFVEDFHNISDIT